MRLDARRTGDAFRASAADLTRIWRAARLSANPALFPGLLDSLVEPFLERLGEALVLGKGPEWVWNETAGVVRVASGREAELDAEWRLLAEVVASACSALEADASAADQAARAVEAARQQAAAHAPFPAGVLAVRQRGGFRPRGDPYAGGRR